MLKLKVINIEELSIYHQLQINAFAQLYAKYQDTESNPDAQSLAFLQERFNLPGRIYILFYHQDVPIGGAKLIIVNNEAKIGPLFIAQEFQNQQLGCAALRLLEKEFPTIHRWYLGTLKQEAHLMHFYQTAGYTVYGEEPITKDLDEVKFEKII